MPRSRLAVALVLPEPYRTEVDGLRRATGGDVERIAPHITLVPPVNVAASHLETALADVRAAAAEVEPLRLEIGPAATFAPINRVLYLAVDGSEADRRDLEALRSALLRGVLHRPDRRAFVPHVTLTSRLASGDDDAALGLLAGYRRTVELDRVDVLRFDVEARRWTTMADVVLGGVRVVGRGGVEVELTTSTRVDPAAADAASRMGEAPAAVVAALADPGRAVVVIGRRAGAVAGLAVGQVDGPVGRLATVGVADAHQGFGIGSHLLAALTLELARRGCDRLVAAGDVAPAVAALLAARGWSSVSRRELVREVG